MRNTLRLVASGAVLLLLAAAGACAAFSEAEAPPTTPTEAGAEGAVDGTASPPSDAATPDTSTDAGVVDVCKPPCAATLVATMTADIRSLACGAALNSPVYVGLTNEIKQIDKVTRVVTPLFAETARHMTFDNPLTFSSNVAVRNGALGSVVADQSPASTPRGVAVTPTTIYWARTAPNEVRSLPRVAAVTDAGTLFASLGSVPEGALIRAGHLHIAMVAAKKVYVFDLDGGASLPEIPTGDVYALANSGSRLYWVAPGDRAIRYTRWSAPTVMNDLVTAPSPASTHQMLSICVDATHVYFGFDKEVHRLPLAAE